MDLRFLESGIGLALFALLLAPAGGITEKVVPVSAADALRTSLAGAEPVYVYEGLPHQSSEADLLRQERKRDDVTKIGDFPFYVPKFQAAEGTSASLKKLLTVPGSYREFGGLKLCGGFHPDYAIAWKADDSEHAILLCFGCHEALFVSGEQRLRYDLNRDPLESLRKLLARFEKKRPSKA